MTPPTLQVGPLDVRLLGFAFVGALAVAFLYVVVRYDDGAADPAYEDDREDAGLPSFGPAYGAGGDDVETVLGIDGEEGTDPGSEPGSRSGSGSGSGPGGPGNAADAGTDASDRERPANGGSAGGSEGDDDGDGDPPPLLDHRVIDDPRDAVLVEVTGGGRSGRFYVADPDAAPAIEPAGAPTERLDAEWRHDAEAYLRAVVLAGELCDRSGG
jgi:hypothetical protein